MSLKQQLKDREKNALLTRPKEIADIMNEATLDLKKTGIEEEAKSSGDIFDNAILLDLNSNDIDLYKLVNGKPAIISFYRGSWCPYCNLELRAYESLLKEEENQDVLMIAISPEKPDVTSVEQDVSKLNFTVLSDVNNELAKKLRIMFHLPTSIQNLYGNKVATSTGTLDYNLPLPSTYVIDSNHKIIKAWIDSNYTKRAEPSEVLALYRTL
ncbi:MAG: peroxiredoxin-like family protein [Sphaerochaetaceae bacterium]|nr:peroxiredoxin-like family protein [Sphaerochaetaceae bacterium]